VQNIGSEYLEFAVDAAYRAGQLTLGYFRRNVRREVKADESPVTKADREAESLLRSLIEETYPGHAIVGEEHGVSKGTDADCRWFIDPIDGTKSFVRGVPLYGVLIGLEIGGTSNVGVAYFPALDEMVYAARGGGCYWNGRRVHVPETDSLAASTVSCTDIGSFSRHGRQEAWERIQKATYYRVGWSDAYGHALVATGRLELMLDPVMSTWDAGPFPVMLREAGGYFGNWSGEETIYGGEGLSTTRTLLPEVLALIRGEQ
jgi:myo-inositol-1(or 4)-monophosphatase